MNGKRSKSLILICSAFISLMVATIPPSSAAGYEMVYHQLLERKQRLMNDRAVSIRNLNQCDSWLKQIDKALLTFSPALNRQSLINSRTYLMNLKDKIYKDLTYQDSTLLGVDKDLAWVESEMKHYACMK